MKFVLRIQSFFLMLCLTMCVPHLLFESAPVLGPWTAASFNVQTFVLGVVCVFFGLSRDSFQVRVGLGAGVLFCFVILLDVLRMAKKTGLCGIEARWTLIPLLYGLLVVLFFGWLLWREKTGRARMGEGPDNRAPMGVPLRTKMLLMATVLAGCFVVLEWVCRVVSSAKWSEASQWRWYAVQVKRNEIGLRNPPIDWGQRVFDKRVLILGDSFAFGFKVDRDKNLSRILEKKLNVVRAGFSRPVKVEVVNASQVNQSIDRQLAFFEAWGKALKPNVVVVAHVLNDVAPESAQSAYSNVFLWWIYHVYAARLVRPIFDGLRHGGTVAGMQQAYSPDSRNWRAYFDQLSRLKARVESQGGQLVFMVFPWISDFENYAFQAAHRALEEKARQMGILFLDLLPSYSQHPAKALQVSAYDLHPNAKAHEIAAEELCSFVENLVSNK